MTTQFSQIPPKPAQQPRLGPSKHDGLAITAIICAFVFPVLGLILGPVSISAAHRDGRRASGLAVAATVISILITVVAIVVIYNATKSAAVDPTQQWINCMNAQLNDPTITCTQPGG